MNENLKLKIIDNIDNVLQNLRIHMIYFINTPN